MRRILIVLLLLLGLAGCGDDPAEQQRNDDITAQMQADLGRRADVVDAEVSYQNTLDAAATAAANVRVKPGAELAPVADEVVRLLWVSTLNPLNGVTVTVWDTDDNQRNEIRRLSFEDAATLEELQAEHGPRPI